MSADFGGKGKERFASLRCSSTLSILNLFSNKVLWEVPSIVGFNFSSRYWFLIFKHLHDSIFFLFFSCFFLPSLTFHLKCIFFLKYFVFSINVVHFILVFGWKHLCCWAFFICFVYLMYLYFPVCLLFVLYNKFILSWFYCFFLYI